MIRLTRLARLSWLPALMIAFSRIAEACPVCYGASDSSSNAGMNTAILVLLGITGFVLGGFVTFFVMVWRRTKKRQAELSNQTYIDRNGDLQTNNDKGVVEWNNF